MLQSTQSCLTWNGEPEATAGKPQVAADVEFYLDIDEASGVEMVHVADPKPQRRQPEFLVRDIARQAFKACLAISSGNCKSVHFAGSVCVGNSETCTNL